MLNEREFSSQEWAPLDERRFRLEPESYRTELSFANFGALRLSRSASSQATRMTTRLPAGDGFGISLIERGESQLVFPGTDEPAGGRVQPILAGFPWVSSYGSDFAFDYDAETSRDDHMSFSPRDQRLL